jgi:hypothetical protein
MWSGLRDPSGVGQVESSCYSSQIGPLITERIQHSRKGKLLFTQEGYAKEFVVSIAEAE